MKRPTDPRAARAREAMLSAAAALLVEQGLEAVTQRAVAVRAGVGRATVYRHWPQLLDLRMAALSAGAPAPPSTAPRPQVASGQDPYAELVHHVHAIAERLDHPASSVVVAVIARAEYDEAVRRLRQRLVTELVESLHTGVDAAIGRGQLHRRLTAETFAMVTVGPLCYQRFLVGTPLRDSTVDDVVDAAVRAWAPSALDEHLHGP